MDTVDDASLQVGGSVGRPPVRIDEEKVWRLDGQAGWLTSSAVMGGGGEPARIAVEGHVYDAGIGKAPRKLVTSGLG